MGIDIHLDGRALGQHHSVKIMGIDVSMYSRVQLEGHLSLLVHVRALRRKYTKLFIFHSV